MLQKVMTSAGEKRWCKSIPMLRSAPNFSRTDAYQGRQFRFRGIRGEHYEYAWSPHDLEELYDLQDDPQERKNLAGDPAFATVQADLKSRLFEWMNAEGDWLAGPGHHPPVGSYIDGRDRSEQHVHSSGC